MVSIDQIRNLIYHTCWEMGDNFGSDEAVQLILETGVVESNYKFIIKYIKEEYGFTTDEEESKKDG